jgi:hypothetical protein
MTFLAGLEKATARWPRSLVSLPLGPSTGTVLEFVSVVFEGWLSVTCDDSTLDVDLHSLRNGQVLLMLATGQLVVIDLSLTFLREDVLHFGRVDLEIGSSSQKNLEVAEAKSVVGILETFR